MGLVKLADKKLT